MDNLQTSKSQSSGVIISTETVKETSGSQDTNGRIRSPNDRNVRHDHFLTNKALPDTPSVTIDLHEEVSPSTFKNKVKNKVRHTRLNRRENLFKNGEGCRIKRITQNGTLHSGMNSGKFKLHGKSNNITSCAEQCCRDRLCDIAVIMTDRCFTVQCYSVKDCEIKNVESNSSDLVIAYMNNRLKTHRTRDPRIKLAGDKEVNKKTVVPNPSEGNEC